MSTTPPSLAQIVMETIAVRTGRRVRDLRVEVRHDRVVLRGKTSSFHVKQLALQGAQEASPGALLENAIVVE
jgi:hypothetical protein